MGRKRHAPLNKLFAWVRRQSAKVKIFLAAACVLGALVALKLLIHDHNHFFVASEAIHFAGILVLIYKLTTQKTCSGLSLKTQELTAVFLAARLSCSVFMEGDIHTFLDFVTLVSTLWVIYMIRFKLPSTYIAKLDNMPLYYVVVPCAILALLVHPYTSHARIGRILWAVSVYLESVSVVPQLRMMQNTKVYETSLSHLIPTNCININVLSLYFSDDRTIYCELRLCTWCCKISRMRSLDHQSLRFRRTVFVLGRNRLHMAAYASAGRSSSDIHPGRLLLLLHQECDEWTTSGYSTIACLRSEELGIWKLLMMYIFFKNSKVSCTRLFVPVFVGFIICIVSLIIS